MPALLCLPFTGENGGQVNLARPTGAHKESGKAQLQRGRGSAVLSTAELPAGPRTTTQPERGVGAAPRRGSAHGCVGLPGEQGSLGISSQLSSDVYDRA